MWRPGRFELPTETRFRVRSVTAFYPAHCMHRLKALEAGTLVDVFTPNAMIS
jgi:hypothetical protein